MAQEQSEKEKLREKVVSEVTGSTHLTYNLLSEYALKNKLDADRVESVNAIMALIDQAVAEARIEEIEDIGQSRHVVVEDDDTIWCEHCHMVLEDSSQDCACEIIYQKRAERLRKLRSQLHEQEKS